MNQRALLGISLSGLLAFMPVTVFAQTLSKSCAEILFLGVYTDEPSTRAEAKAKFMSTCWAEVTKAYGPKGVPPKGDASALAMAAMVITGIATVLEVESQGGSGPADTGQVLGRQQRNGGLWAGRVIPGAGPGGVVIQQRGPSGGGIDAFPRQSP